MISEITTIIFEISSLLYNIFYIINDDKYNNLKRLFGWTNTNFLLFFIIFLMIFLTLIPYCFKVIKFTCLIITIIIYLFGMYLTL